MSPQLKTDVTEGTIRASIRRRAAVGGFLVLAAAAGGALLLGPAFSRAQTESAEPVSEAAMEAVSMERPAGLAEIAASLDAELNRLDAASQKLDARADQLFGPEVDGARKLRLPEDHDGLMRYLNASVAFVDDVVHSFGELVPGDDQVDLRERIPQARKHIARLEASGVASMLARRQVRAWIEKDMQAVEALCDDWEDIGPSTRLLIGCVKRYEDGGAKLDELVKQHQAVLDSADTRTNFDKSKIGVLCRQAVEGAREIDRERRSGLVANEPVRSAMGIEPN